MRSGAKIDRTARAQASTRALCVFINSSMTTFALARSLRSGRPRSKCRPLIGVQNDFVFCNGAAYATDPCNRYYLAVRRSCKRFPRRNMRRTQLKRMQSTESRINFSRLLKSKMRTNENEREFRFGRSKSSLLFLFAYFVFQ